LEAASLKTCLFLCTYRSWILHPIPQQSIRKHVWPVPPLLVEGITILLKGKSTSVMQQRIWRQRCHKGLSRPRGPSLPNQLGYRLRSQWRRLRDRSSVWS